MPDVLDLLALARSGPGDRAANLRHWLDKTGISDPCGVTPRGDRVSALPMMNLDDSVVHVVMADRSGNHAGIILSPDEAMKHAAAVILAALEAEEQARRTKP